MNAATLRPMTTMSAKLSGTVRGASPAPFLPPTLAQRVSALHEAAQKSDHVFASPLGPFRDGARELYVPRFVYFGPHTSHESVRLAVLAGFGRHDRGAVKALLAFIENLTHAPDIGQSLNVSFFPVANVIGLASDAEERDLSEESWSQPAAPEIALLRQEILRSHYQVFIRITTSTDDQPAAWVRSVRSTTAQSSDVQVFSSTDFHPWSVSFETVSADSVGGSLLGLAGQMAFSPFEVELALPADWSQRTADQALATKLKRLIVHYRAFLAFGQHL